MTNSNRFTLDGSDALERRLGAICERVVSGTCERVPKSILDGILLAGGYGRGEGGVLKTAAGDEPYNDLEFYVLLKGDCRANEKKYHASFHQLGDELKKQIGIDVEFKILSRQKLESSPCSMFYYDLVSGHKQLWGSPDLLSKCDHHRRADDIPLAEATRLLMNRCSGLLYAWARLENSGFSAESADFVARNQAKAQLAFGDVVLTVHRRYHVSCRERLARLEALRGTDATPSFPLILAHHRHGVEFKLHPVKSTASRKELLAQQNELCELGRQLWLWLESHRLGRSFANVCSYARDRINKCPETVPLRNALINLSLFGPGAIQSNKLFRYPRERLLEALPLLLWNSGASRDLTPRQLVQQRLRTSAVDFHDLVGAYENLWKRFN